MGTLFASQFPSNKKEEEINGDLIAAYLLSSQKLDAEGLLDVGSLTNKMDAGVESVDLLLTAVRLSIAEMAKGNMDLDDFQNWVDSVAITLSGRISERFVDSNMMSEINKMPACLKPSFRLTLVR